MTRGRDWLAFATDLRLDDLTSTSFEGRLAGKPKAQQGYARDHGPGGQQLGLGLVVNRDGFPRGFEALAGHTRDAATLTPLLTALEQRGGGARRVGGFDRGMATEDQLRHGRQSQRVYVAAVRRAVTRPYLEAIRRGPWRCLGAAGPDEPTLEVQLWPDQERDGIRERWWLCRSAGGHLKERPMVQTRLTKARQRLTRRQAQVAAGTFPSRDVLPRRARPALGRRPDLRGIFTWAVQRTADAQELRLADNAAARQEVRDLQGVSWLRTTATARTPAARWHTSLLRTRVEAAVRNLHTDLCLRPIFPSKEARGDAHVWFAVLAYALSVARHLRHRRAGGQLPTAALLEELPRVPLAAWWFRTTDGEWLRFERASAPSAAPPALLDTLGWPIPEAYQPPNLDTDPARLECQHGTKIPEFQGLWPSNW